MAKRNKDQERFQPLRPKSRVPKIFEEGDGGHPEGGIDIADFPLSARSAFEVLQRRASIEAVERGYQAPECPIRYAKLSAFVSMECYFSWNGRIKDEERPLCFLLRVKDALKIDIMTAHESEERAAVVMLGFDALTQLSRIPDILTSPPCLELLSRAETRLAYGRGFYGRPAQATPLEGRLVEEADYFFREFRSTQLSANEKPRRLALEAKHWRIAIGLAEYLKQPKQWHDEAARKIKNFIEVRKGDLASSVPVDIPAEIRKFKVVVEYYNRKLHL